ncbi:MAG: DsbA family protein [Deltaproteobacteria bacterium]|nr:DsbA family protein [Deltaproteobacteria bacterium]
MTRTFSILPILAFFLGTGLVLPLAGAQTPACDALTGEARSVARYLVSTEHPYDCCDETIEKCIKARPDCQLAVRLADFVCRRAAAGQDRTTIQRALQRRATSMMRPGRTVKTDLAKSPMVGCSKAGVKVVAYVCLRCPFCSKMVPELYREVTAGRLAGKVALHLRLFPIKSHTNSMEANLAVAAAASLGRMWEYLLLVYRHFDAFEVGRLAGWATEAGMGAAAFEGALTSAAVKKSLVASKKEGLRNGVVATPTLFINGRKYVGDLDVETLVDVIEEESEAVGR